MLLPSMLASKIFMLRCIHVNCPFSWLCLPKNHQYQTIVNEKKNQQSMRGPFHVKSLTFQLISPQITFTLQSRTIQGFDSQRCSDALFRQIISRIIKFNSIINSVMKTNLKCLTWEVEPKGGGSAGPPGQGWRASLLTPSISLGQASKGMVSFKHFRQFPFGYPPASGQFHEAKVQRKTPSRRISLNINLKISTCFQAEGMFPLL